MFQKIANEHHSLLQKREGAVRAWQELPFEGDWCNDAWDVAVVLDEPMRFKEPVMRQAAN